MVEFHLVAGLLALLAGFVALFWAKGGYLHRRSGRLFVGAMLLMLGTAAFMAFFVVDKRSNGIGALLTIYLVVTSLLTVTRRVDQVRGVTRGLAVFAFLLGALAFVGGVQATMDPAAMVDGGPSRGDFVIAAIAFATGASDLRMLARGSIAGAQRLVRHLWRMTFALWVATGSFFLGQAKVIPEPLRNFALLSIPVLAVLAALLYWLWRLNPRKTHAPPAVHGEVR
jgi:uncharacterized membrane protein